MNTRLFSALVFGATFALTFAVRADATTTGKTADGRDYATGGVTVEELRSLAADRERYGLWVTTAAKGSGAFLSDVELKITDAKKAVVLDTMMIGPWLLVDLAPGTYTIEATTQGQRQKYTTRIQSGEHRQAILYFESPAKVSPDWTSPFANSPYAAN